MTTDNKKYNLSVSPMWNTSGGNLMGIEITDEIYDAIQQVEKGGKLFIKFLPDERRKTETSPHAYLEYITKESVREYKDKHPDAFVKGNARRSAPPAESDTI